MTRAEYQELQKRGDADRRRLGRVLLTTDGAELLEQLEREYAEGKLFAPTPEETAYRVGKRDLVLVLRALRDLAQGDAPPPPEGGTHR